MPSQTFFSSAGDGIIRNAAASSWATVIGASTGTVADATGDPQIMVQAAGTSTYGDSKFYCDRQFFAFDTSGLPDDAVITSVKLGVYITTVDSTSAGGSVNVFQASQATNTTLSTSDFGSVGGTAYATAINFASLTASAYNEWTLNSTGMSFVSLTGFTKLCLRSSQDSGNSAPTGANWSAFSGRNSEHTGTASDPYLTVTYSLVKTYTADAVIIDTSARLSDTFTGTSTLLTHTPDSGGVWAQNTAFDSGTTPAASISGGFAFLSASGSDAALVYSSTGLDDGSITANIKIASGLSSFAGCGMRVSPTAGSGLFALVDNGGFLGSGVLRLYRYGGAGTASLGTYSTSWTTGTTYAIRLECAGTSVNVYVDGTLRISVTESSITSGRQAIRFGPSSASTGCIIDSVSFTSSPVKTYTADAVVVDTSTVKLYTADAIIKAVVTKTYTADAMVAGPAAVIPALSGSRTAITTAAEDTAHQYNYSIGYIYTATGARVACFQHTAAETPSPTYGGSGGDGHNSMRVKRLAPGADPTVFANWVVKADLDASLTNGAAPGDVTLSYCNWQGTANSLVAIWTEVQPVLSGDAAMNAYNRYSVSTDDGLTWSAGADFTTLVGFPQPGGYISGGGYYELCPAPLLELANGDLMLVTYKRTTTSFTDYEFTTQVYKSTDHGSTWGSAVSVHPHTTGQGYDEPFIVQLPSGRILCMSRTYEGMNVTPTTSPNYFKLTYWLCYSDDNGATWTSPQRVMGPGSTQSTPSGVTYWGVGNSPRMTVMPNGTVIILSRMHHWTGSAYQPTGPGYSVSTDGGITWSAWYDARTGSLFDFTSTTYDPSMHGQFRRTGTASMDLVYANYLAWPTNPVQTYYQAFSSTPGFVSSQTYTADAIISASGGSSSTKTYTADAVIYAPPYSVSYTADGLVKGLGLTLPYTADARVVDAASQSAALSWFFRHRRSSMSQQTKTYTVVQAKGTARTATWTSPTYKSETEAGILVVLDVTAASGTGGLTLRVNAHDLAGSVEVPLNSAPTAVTATGTTSYAIYPFGAISGALTQSTSGYLPRQFSITVTHGDSSSYTYSVGYCLLP